MTSCSKSDLNTYAVVLTNEITDTNQVPAVVFTKTVAFDVEIIDPCESTTITAITDFTSDAITCYDNENDAKDSGDNGCSYYTDSPEDCGSFDDADFTSSDLCCACTGGVQTLELPYGDEVTVTWSGPTT